jgi:hypothetical protein
VFSDFENMELIIIIGIQIVFYILTAFVKAKKRSKGNIRNVLLGVLQALVLYISILVIVKIIDIRLEQRLNSFDLDGDGFFGGAEITPEQQKAMSDCINDTGRNFAPFTGGFLALVYIPFAIGTEYIIDSIINKMGGLKKLREKE